MTLWPLEIKKMLPVAFGNSPEYISVLGASKKLNELFVVGNNDELEVLLRSAALDQAEVSQQVTCSVPGLNFQRCIDQG